MHLRTIRLRGFKSFVEPLELTLQPGVAVVVGPNGSGKSNVADAIVWAAGSLAPSELRAEKPDDVLFSGGGDRKAADHCEVELVFDNEDGAFPDLDYSEVAITRRLVRGGEGQYLVNKTPVRRTDLVELLADVGLGGTMHSIVSQGKVDAVLASKPEDRRALVEEAAGLGKFKRRRHRAELKLARVATQVERARDVEEEVRKRLRPLALQATAAERAEKLVVEIAALRARIAELDLAGIADRRVQAEERRDAAAIARRATHEKLTALLQERQQAEDELSDAAGRRETALGALYRLQGASERIALRRESATGLEERLRQELEDAERAVADRSDATVRALEQAAAAAAATARDDAEASGRAQEQARLAHARLAAFEQRLSRSAEERLAALRFERVGVETALAGVAGGHEGANRTLLALGSARERLAVRRESAAALAERLAGELGEARALVRSGGPSPAELEAAANEAAALARAAASERDDVIERARSARERLAALEQAIAAREGIPPAARALAQAGETLALSALEPDPGAERAVAAALAWRASAVLARSTGAAVELLERARREGLGSLAVVVVGQGGTHTAATPTPGARLLRELVRGDEAALQLLDGIWLVEPERLLDASHGTVITAEGHGYDADRGELWFAGETAEVLLLEMDARRRSLADEADELAARADAATRAADEATARAGAAEAAYGAVAHLRDRASDPELLERLAALAAGLERAAGRAAAAALRIEEPLAARLTIGAARTGELGSELRRLSTLEADAAREAADAAARAQAAEVVVARLGGSGEGMAPDEAADRETLAGEAQHLLAAADLAAAAARAAADRARAADAALVERAPRRSALDPDMLARLCATAEALGAGLAAAAGLAARFEAPVRARVDAGAERAARLGDDLRRLGAAEVDLRRQAEEASERSTHVQVELARLEAEADEAALRLEKSGAETPAEGDDRDELAARADRLDSRREELGKVNPLAKEEYEAEKERLEELAAQRQDLENSLAEIAKLRDELAETVQQRFTETFDAVARNFEEVAATLFPGGEGRLRLVEAEDEGGEPGIEVELRPAGKRVTRLSLLSGGEKALGAISFLFSLFLAKPCPFYLLDEVEAALDDANIARFVTLLRSYADRAQFVVITHQKRTMEAADVLYGVTMGPDGVSQVVSRRLPRHEAVAAATA